MILKNFTGFLLTYFPATGGNLVVIPQHGCLLPTHEEHAATYDTFTLGNDQGFDVKLPVKTMAPPSFDQQLPIMEGVAYIVSPAVAAMLPHRQDIFTYKVQTALSDSAIQISHLYRQPSL